MSEDTLNNQEPQTEKEVQAGIHALIKANFDNKVDVKDVKFHFKSAKDEATGLVSKRPTVELALPVPSVEGIIEILEKGGKGLDLLLEAVADVVISRAREVINSKEDINQDNFPLAVLAWEAIASLPKAERKGGGIAKETWEDFSEDYISVMPAVTGKSPEQIGNAAKIFVSKFSSVKTNKLVLKLLKDQLALYAANSPAAETYADCISFLSEKADALYNMDEASLLANL